MACYTTIGLRNEQLREAFLSCFLPVLTETDYNIDLARLNYDKKLGCLMRPETKEAFFVSPLVGSSVGFIDNKRYNS
jgi:hypothetical protein